jgi:hypothetical protein
MADFDKHSREATYKIEQAKRVFYLETTEYNLRVNCIQELIKAGQIYRFCYDSISISLYCFIGSKLDRTKDGKEFQKPTFKKLYNETVDLTERMKSELNSFTNPTTIHAGGGQAMS